MSSQASCFTSTSCVKMVASLPCAPATGPWPQIWTCSQCRTANITVYVDIVWKCQKSKTGHRVWQRQHIPEHVTTRRDNVTDDPWALQTNGGMRVTLCLYSFHKDVVIFLFSQYPQNTWISLLWVLITVCYACSCIVLLFKMFLLALVKTKILSLIFHLMIPYRFACCFGVLLLQLFTQVILDISVS